MILAGDTGGTKTTLGLYDRGRTIVETTYPCAEFPSLEAIIEVFLAAHRPAEAIDVACFAVAGPVIGGTAKITNLPWTIDVTSLSAKLGGVRVSLLNDLQATAFGALTAAPEALVELQRGTDAANGTRTIAVIAPGTGLGEALLFHDGARYHALPSEGGHADFAPCTDEEIELLRFLRARHGDHVSNERVLSGPGIGELYDFARSSRQPEPAWLANDLAAGDRSAAITRNALDEKDAACIRALGLFAELLGAEAGNVVLRTLATAIVIGGGIPPKIMPVLQHGAFLARFNGKGRFAAWTRGVNVCVLLEPRAALFGAAYHAANTKDLPP